MTPIERPSPAAADGIAFHAAVETGVSPPAGPVRDMHDAWMASEWSHVKWEHETAFAYEADSDTGRVVGRGRGAYASEDGSARLGGPMTFFGTADLVLVDRHDGHPDVEEPLITIADTKTGFQASHDRTPAADHDQLRVLALMAARAYGIDRVRIVLLDVTPDGVDADDAILDSMDLDQIASELRADLTRPEGPPTPGSWCTQPFPCPAVGVCPATQRALDTVPTALVTLNTAPKLVLALKQAEARIESLWEQIRALAGEEGRIPLEDGGVYRRSTVEKETIDADGPAGAEAQAILARYGAGGAVRVKTSATWKDVRAALKQVSQAPKEIESVLRSELARCGALRSTSYEQWRVLPPRKGAVTVEDADGKPV